jgi:hypothetical protein
MGGAVTGPSMKNAAQMADLTGLGQLGVDTVYARNLKRLDRDCVAVGRVVDDCGSATAEDAVTGCSMTGAQVGEAVAGALVENAAMGPHVAKGPYVDAVTGPTQSTSRP